ncbi:MAG: hypothetical protein OXU62_12955 [Gammaproteobacteria bacterium]|nr:hypothetical protein [Gammaproteobacteria bacterium]
MRGNAGWLSRILLSAHPPRREICSAPPVAPSSPASPMPASPSPSPSPSPSLSPSPSPSPPSPH